MRRTGLVFASFLRKTAKKISKIVVAAAAGRGALAVAVAVEPEQDAQYTTTTTSLGKNCMALNLAFSRSMRDAGT